MIFGQTFPCPRCDTPMPEAAIVARLEDKGEVLPLYQCEHGCQPGGVYVAVLSQPGANP